MRGSLQRFRLNHHRSAYAGLFEFALSRTAACLQPKPNTVLSKLLIIAGGTAYFVKSCYDKTAMHELPIYGRR